MRKKIPTLNVKNKKNLFLMDILVMLMIHTIMINLFQLTQEENNKKCIFSALRLNK